MEVKTVLTGPSGRPQTCSETQLLTSPALVGACSWTEGRLQPEMRCLRWGCSWKVPPESLSFFIILSSGLPRRAGQVDESLASLLVQLRAKEASEMVFPHLCPLPIAELSFPAAQEVGLGRTGCSENHRGS